ncbi:hypothetical protein WB66_08300 [bacteria symbiont BFo1 of Frankliniella occidentalis]|jgi:antitoxin component of RelBE/YafQ-DinJ toxin-antitoxin module|uniref:Uncharacterized protein n=1 Tax=Erwinia aphidicola TaxID=68334 RepID=A0ABU8DGX7_ERWAP|nr:hypothetical protein [Erwinia aphidicola]KMV71091.1 hypothetical protein AI28_18495 [bacteria symbiont BFo1 of Frankliniella occidentalis]VTT28613.1 Uncharacterised protein [Klebsiella pneumoniae]KYP85112.1 hypothetical protein WB66_08300 [bacteria symbiont BFo1 of Frankliniella occidentalis]KYP91112.1 hypothetical protein WB91_06690 [bacteria symbiont BFo1 of Frankliniella occidentalis]MBD1374344.1 hypothetical protein [Erwinia aphidicola]
MTDKVSLTIKIDPSLKETIKAVALENQLSLSEVVTTHLVKSLSAQPAAVDSLDTEEAVTEQLSAAELKQIRSLLKKSKKKK